MLGTSTGWMPLAWKASSGGCRNMWPANPSEPMAPLVWESADVVRIMTVHQAKGWNFRWSSSPTPTVPLAAQWEVVRFSREAGPVPYGSDFSPGGLRAAFSRAEEEENLRELYRLFYVACTRAADYLILSAGLDARWKNDRTWMSLLAERFACGAGACRATSAGGSAAAQRSGRFPSLWKWKCLRKLPRPKWQLKHLLQQFQQSPQRESVPEKNLRYLVAIPPDATARREYSFTSPRHAGDGCSASASTLPTARRMDGAGGNARGGADLAASRGSRRICGTICRRPAPFVRSGRTGFWSRCWPLCSSGPPVSRLSPTRIVAPLAEGALRRGWGSRLSPLTRSNVWIRRFLASPRGQAITRAAKGLSGDRIPFGFGPVRRLAVSQPYFRGFFDCLYPTEQGDWVIVDYKTNQVPPDGIASVAENLPLAADGTRTAWQRRRLVGLDAAGTCALYFLRSGRRMDRRLGRGLLGKGRWRISRKPLPPCVLMRCG